MLKSVHFHFTTFSTIKMEHTSAYKYFTGFIHVVFIRRFLSTASHSDLTAHIHFLFYLFISFSFVFHK